MIMQSRHMMRPFKGALSAGFDLLNEPIFGSILYNIHLNLSIGLKKKARILVPNACVLIGVADFTGLLKEGEVYVRTMKSATRRMVQGDIVVTKNPCSHPGDIRKLKAVNTPEIEAKLGHLLNVIVFPVLGSRPEQNKMSGGDLDGDVYFACWQKEIVETIQTVHDPQKYEKPKPGEVIEETPKSDRMADFVTYYLSKDLLGTIANRHTALCDQYGEDGPLTEECKSLSSLQAIAVDFAKHGKCVNPDYLKSFKVASWPDWLEKNDGKRPRISEGILGKLWRDV